MFIVWLFRKQTDCSRNVIRTAGCFKRNEGRSGPAFSSVPNFVPTSKLHVLPAIAIELLVTAYGIVTYRNSLVVRGKTCKFFVYVSWVT
jgi:hypothetical protein